MNLLQQQIQLKPEKDPRIASLKRKIFTFKQLGHFPEIDTPEKLQGYIEKCRTIQRPEESPRVFICSSQKDFDYLLNQLRNWELFKKDLIKINNRTIKPGKETIRDTFFYDEDLGYFKPSNYFVLINPNQEVIRQIELKANQVSNQAVSFDEQSKMDSLPNTTDPFILDEVDSNSRRQILVGDKILYPYQDQNDDIVIKSLRITF